MNKKPLLELQDQLHLQGWDVPLEAIDYILARCATVQHTKSVDQTELLAGQQWNGPVEGKVRS